MGRSASNRRDGAGRAALYLTAEAYSREAYFVKRAARDERRRSLLLCALREIRATKIGTAYSMAAAHEGQTRRRILMNE
ncbi:hypothetical protein COMA2_20030 [Candidatus Nitrospira nitrificans]|uniref:Uncharacterized protein n=1 Tax=Candidatus Nitrospira nitrificans TaxID=1742973 RepID=A0A0S4LIL9_9BACT|nr:hypothetical protein COMA2_20030 [Candidatus Nitrospira nitrificans]